MKKLSKKEALEILPLVVDNEATKSEKDAFFSYIQRDEEVKKHYESMLFIKQMLKTKYSPEKAPDYLKDKVSRMIEDLKSEDEISSDLQSKNTPSSVKVPVNDSIPASGDTKKSGQLYAILKPARYVIAASVIFFFTLITVELLEKSSTNGIQAVTYDIEEIALSHFTNGSHVTASLASFQPASIDDASDIIEDEMSHQLRMPLINGAELSNIYYTTFADGFTTPVLEFYQAGIEETIHVFAFRMEDLQKHKSMKPDPEAVERCKTYDDYHVKDIEGKHVVSWKWGDYWYTAVSNHDGNDLIALVEPSNPSWYNESSDDDGW